MSEVGAKKAFLSHASVDGELARRIATDLRRHGVDVWYDEWALKPGDSLRMMIERGLEEAEVFFVLLTPASITSPWVQSEIDAAFIRRMDGSCRLVPIIHDVEFDDVPLLIRTLVITRLHPYEEQVRKLAHSCLNVSSAPELGDPPDWAAKPAPAGFTPVAARIAEILSRSSAHGMTHDPVVDIFVLRDLLGLSDEELEDATSELKDRSMISVSRAIGRQCIRGIRSVSPEIHLYEAFDQLVHGWSTRDDARAISASIVNSKGNRNAQAVAEEFEWPIRRVNPACGWLKNNQLIVRSDTIAYPYECLYLIPNERTGRFARTGQY